MKKRLFLGALLIQVIITTLSSCVNQKQIAYFQKGVNQSDTIQVAKIYVPRVQPGDILSISVGSLNPLASSFFNPFSTMPVGGGDNGNASINNVPLAANSGVSSSALPSSTQTSAPGYLVDPSGSIDYPILGTLKLAGLTTLEVKELIKSKLKTYLKEPTVNVRFLNYKVSVMGEVLHPSVYVIPNEIVTLPEALSMAGDLTIFGKRDNVLIIRDSNGKKEFGRVDLTTRDVYNSPFYYLHANDIVYVEPNKGKVAQSDKAYQILPIILSALSFISIILVYSKR